MSFSTPKVKPDKAAQAAQIRQENLADSALTDSIQSLLVGGTRDASRIFGVQPNSPRAGYNGGGAGFGGGRGMAGGGGGWFR